MPLNRSDILASAVALLDTGGLDGLTMRRLATSLGIQPGALYWHFANKQVLLEAVADLVLADLDGVAPVGDWDQRINELAHRLRAALLAHRDGAELVATAQVLRRGRDGILARMTEVLTDAGLTPVESRLAADALLHYVFGHTADEQAQVAVERDEESGESGLLGETARFGFGLSIFLDGLRARIA